MFERDIRSMAVIPRWGIVDTIKDQSNAEHSYMVAVYTSDICILLELDDATSLIAIRAALWHDIDEIVSGDAPGHVKKFLMRHDAKGFLRGCMDKIFGSMFPIRAGLIHDNEKQGLICHHVVKVADCIDAAQFLLREERLGNAEVRDLIEDQVELATKFLDGLADLVGTGPKIDQLRLVINGMKYGRDYQSPKGPRIHRYMSGIRHA